MNPRRSASVGALPREKKHFVSRNESASGISLEVQCACQFYESNSLLPERINPVDSRPASKLGFLNECEYHQGQPSSMLSDVGSTRSFNMYVHGHASPAPMEYDRLSMRSTGGTRPSSEQIIPAVDLTFVEKYPELEETARSRGLIVGCIASPEITGGSGDIRGTFLAGMRGRQMSVGGLSTSMRDPDAISIRSGISVRRISRSPSKTDLFVADLNIPIPQSTQREQRSVSVSRRNSNMDLTPHGPAYAAPSSTLNVSPLSYSPPKASSAIGLTASGNASSHRSPSPSPTPLSGDFRAAKVPLSADYMRPSENKDFQGFRPPPNGELLPQNRPIDVRKYDRFNITPATSFQPLQNQPKGMTVEDTALPDRVTVTAFKTKDLIQDPLQHTVALLEQDAAARNIEDISDYIQVETREPPNEVAELREPSLNLGEETQIDIFSAVPVVDIDQFVHEEALKAEEEHNRRSRPPSRQTSPVRKRQLSSPGSREDKRVQLQLPDIVAEPHVGTPQDPHTHSPIKRQRASDQRFSPTRSVTIQEPGEIQSQQPMVSNNNAKSISNVVPKESKASYTSRFKSIFNHNKKHHESESFPKPPIDHQRKKSLSPVRLVSASRERSASPKSNKLLSMISKPQPATIERVRASSKSLVTKDTKGWNEPTAVRVIETFSLKVDDMDQYSMKPQKPPTLAASSSSDLLAHSRDDFQAMERVAHSPDNLSEAFVPVVLAPTPNRSPYSSELDIKMRRGRELSSSSQFSMAPKGQLFSAPINLEGGASPRLELFEQPIRSPSETRATSRSSSNIIRTPSFLDGRTQSQDRAPRSSGLHENLFESRMNKTVSFNFEKRKSRLSDFQNSIAQRDKEKQSMLHPSNYKR